MKPVMTQNSFLSNLPRELVKVFDRHVELIHVTKGETDKDAKTKLGYIYFPLTCVYSLELPMADGFSSHLALLGYRYAIGARNALDLSMLGVPRAIIPGFALKMRSEIFSAEMGRWPELRRATHDQFLSVTNLLGVTSGCNLRHPLPQRLARWLLNLTEASGTACFELTHEELSQFLGVRREAVTEALSRLSRAAVVSTSRGQIRLVNPYALVSFACECSQTLHCDKPQQSHYNTLLKAVGTS